MKTLRDLADNSQRPNIHVIRVPGKEKENGAKHRRNNG